MGNAHIERAVEVVADLDRQISDLCAALRWCLEEGLDDYVQETELQRITEYRALLNPMRNKPPDVTQNSSGNAQPKG